MGTAAGLWSSRITEKWWDSSYTSPLLEWRVGRERYRSFRRSGRELRSQRWSLWQWPAGVHGTLPGDGWEAKTLWIRIKGRARTGVITMGVCYGLSDQEDQADQSLFRERGQAWHSQALVVFNHPNICPWDKTIQQGQVLCWSLFPPRRRDFGEK